MEEYSIPLLRTAFIARQGLHREPQWKTVHEAVQRVAAVQIDTISVVSRSHHLTLRNRIQNYHRDSLWTALRNHEVFEHFAHGVCFVPIEEFPYYRCRMERIPTHGWVWTRRLLTKHRELMDSVEQRIRDEGPLGSKDFQDTSGRKRTGFWDWKPAKHALDLLWETGRLMVTERKGFQRIYDLTERVIPSKYLDMQIEEDQVWRYFLQRSLECLVAGTARDLRWYISCDNFALETKKNLTKTMKRLLETLKQEDIVTEIAVPDVKRQYYVMTRQLPFLQNAQDQCRSTSRAWFLSPFDNIVWDRIRVKRLFDVDIKLEAYTPKAQRKFGYYVTPILWRNRIIGRIDPKADRLTSTLVLYNAEVNLPLKEIAESIEPIQRELERFKEFHNLDRIKVERVKPTSLKTQLET